MADTPDPESVEPDEAFDKLIWGSGEICNNCFEKVVEIDLPEEYLSPILYENHKDIQGEVRQYDGVGTIEIVESDVNEYGNQTIDHPGTVCLNCGSIHLQTWQYGYSETLSKKQAIKRADNLADRLEEYGYTVNKERMVELLAKGKSRSSLQGKDKELFAKAVKVGIQ